MNETQMREEMNEELCKKDEHSFIWSRTTHLDFEENFSYRECIHCGYSPELDNR